MKDYKNTRYQEPMSLEAKIVHGGAFIAVLLAVTVAIPAMLAGLL